MTTSHSRWLRVDPATFDRHETVVGRGVEFHVFLSPYDLPEAVRGAFDRATNRFVIEFRYVTDEPTATVAADKHVTLFIGKNSKRLRRIAVDVKGMGAREVALRIDQAIDALPRAITGRVPTTNFTVARDVIHRKRPELLASLG